MPAKKSLKVARMENDVMETNSNDSGKQLHHDEEDSPGMEVAVKKNGKSNKTKNDGKFIQCWVCDLTMENQDIYKQHLQLHTGEKIYDCKTCNRAFSRQATLRKHELTHLTSPTSVKKHSHLTSSTPIKKQTHLVSSTPVKKQSRAPKLQRVPKVGIFVCKVCPGKKAFQTSLALSNHMRMHKKSEAPYGCKSCPLRFNQWNQLKVHLREVHGEQPRQSGGSSKLLYQCGDCKETFFDYAELKAHVTNIRNQHVVHPGITTSSYYTCVQCRKWYPTIARLHEHVKSHLRTMEYEEFLKSQPVKAIQTKAVKARKEKGIVACEICFQRFATFGIYKLHMRRHSAVAEKGKAAGEKPKFQCVDCKKTFVEYYRLKEHVSRVRNGLIIHHPPVTESTTYACLECKKSFPAIARVHKHVKTHFPNMKDLKTPIKPSTKSNITKVNVARINVAKINVAKINAAKINAAKINAAKINAAKINAAKINAAKINVAKSSSSSSNIIVSKAKEMVVVKQENLVQCEVCLQKFPTRGAYKLHMQTHTGEKPYLCSICKRAFSRLATLKQHKALVHVETEKEEEAGTVMQCQVCKQQFRNEAKLRVHMLQHNEITDKPFECQYCHKRFVQSRCLSLHLRIHSQEEKPLQCNLCNERFHWKYQVRDHVMRVHPLPAMFA